MSNIPPAVTPPPAAAPQPPASATAVEPKRASVADALPTGVKVDHTHDADSFFKAHQAANPKPGEAAPAAPVAPAAPPAAAAPAPVVETPVAPTKGLLSEKLAARSRPAVAAPVEPAAASAKNPEDEIKLDEKYTAPAHESFNKIKSITTGLRDQLNAARETERQLRDELTVAKSGAPTADTAEVERLRADFKTVSDRLALVDLREHPKFKQEFIEPTQQALDGAAALLTANGVQGVDVTGLLSKPRSELGKAVSEITKNLPDFDRVEFSENIRKAWTLNQQATAALGKSKEVYSGLKNQTEASQKQAFERTWGRAAGQVAEHIIELEAPDNATPDERVQIDQYNAAFKGLRTVAEQRAFGPATAEVISENAIKSAAYDFHIQKAMPRLIKEIDGLLNLNRKLAGELTAIRGRNPNLQVSGASNGGSGGGANADGTLSNDQLSKMTHAEAAAALAPRKLG